MRKITAETESNPQASERGMASTGATGFDVITTGAAGMASVGWINNGWVFVMLIAGAATGEGRGKTLIRAVSFFGPRLMDGAAVRFSSRAGGTDRLTAFWSALFSTPGGFGKGCNSDDETGETGGMIGGRRGETLGSSAVDSEEGSEVSSGGNRRIGVRGVREGRTIRVVSCFASPGAEVDCSGCGCSAMRTVSFFGSAIRVGVR